MKDIRTTSLVTGLLVMTVSCAGLTGQESGSVRDVVPISTPSLYSPVDRGALAYGLPTAVAGKTLVASPRSITLADERELADDPVVRKLLVDRGLGPDAITIEQREDTYEMRPDVAVSAMQLKGVPAELFADFVPSVYLLATSATSLQHNLASEKPAREVRTIADREVRYSDWGEFFVVWYPYGDVVYITLADSPERLAAAVRALPGPDAEPVEEPSAGGIG